MIIDTRAPLASIVVRNVADTRPAGAANYAPAAEAAQKQSDASRSSSAKGTEAERLLKGSGWLPEVLRRSDLAALDGNGAAEGQGALNEEPLGAAGIDAEINLPAFLMADLPVESTAMMAAE